MKKIIYILVSSIIAGVLIFLSIRIWDNVTKKAENLYLAKKCAIDYVERKYPGYKFVVSDIRKRNDDYVITLKVDRENYQLVSISCLVREKVNDSNEFYASVWLSSNEDLLKD